MPLKFNSDDTEGSDLSYESSFDEKEDNQEELGQKNINLFKEQMERFLLTHPELQDNIKYSKNSMQVEPDSTNKNYQNNMWNCIANNVIQECKRTNIIPSIENFSQRLNLFRKKIEKPDAIELILQNKDQLLKQINKEEERKAKIQNKIHETIEAKLRKQQGDVKYFSQLKKNQFDSRMKKEEAKVRQTGEKIKENNSIQLQVNQSSKNSNIINIDNLANTLQSPNGNQLDQKSNNEFSNQQVYFRNRYSQEKYTRESSSLNNNQAKKSQQIRFSVPCQSLQIFNVDKKQNPILKNNQNFTIKNQSEEQKQGKAFKARPIPAVFDKRNQDNKKKMQSETELDIPLDIEFKTAKGEQLYKEVKKMNDEEAIKRHIIKTLILARQQAEDEFKSKPSLLSQGQKYYSEESKEFSLLSPNFLAKKKIQEMKEQGIINENYFEYRANLEEGNVYLLTKVNKILKGNILKKWKSIQDSKF